ncbi:hypothetical protein [Deinococcus sp.]|uniref:hypothetical protein n=1 Tax=Deinococcus sp. TaxID=47478 RepID=UPI0025C6A03F|nr:hypothetical protein [Deinococcus sp.]
MQFQNLPQQRHARQPLLLRQVIDTYLETYAHTGGPLLYQLDIYLGSPAPLLAYTKLTGEAWLRTLPHEQTQTATALLSDFRAYLRDEGWLDAARPVNQFD